ncbi:LacI family DNA-binding transcriptional regulator [Alicyclobacillus dauci]|uniref:LacI family transcriptional regulator n=1 Tax=Alicyclobacillus dauci TaxID=1475485 RepID=A0ABY6Z3Q0_9BACL|nr:LacI family DNA-binding transcriptional regulator [Alicyclobacillus dauci]WAH36914.1 LacI family transcriptional regulator [Alicyclobacillus dauci]
MKKRVKIHDVAERAGVSITTVSRYLNERYEAMSDATRQRIASVIEELGYRPNVLAQGLKGNRTRSIAAIVVNMGYPFCVGLIRSLNRVLSPAGYNLFVCETGGDRMRERDMIESVQAQGVDGMVLQTGGQNNDLLADIAKVMPVIFVDRYFDLPNVTNVITNNLDASRQMTDYLYRSGYKRILYVTEAEAGINTRKDRLAGYIEASGEAGVSPWVIKVDRGDQATFKDAAEALATPDLPWPRAVYTANGLLMMQLYRYVREKGFEVPTELGLATFDEPDWAGLVAPTLTCVRQPIDEMGEWTGRQLLAHLSKHLEPTGQSRLEVIESGLVIGGSTAHITQNVSGSASSNF